jgi:chloramphenicol O-acetyltransferase type A
MKKNLDLSTWSRREQFQFFRRFEEPFFGVCVSVDCTKAYARAKEQGASFFLYYLHKCLVAANRIEPFRYRIDGDDVVVWDVVHASPTINRPDGTFGFAYMDYHEDFTAFAAAASVEVARIQATTGLVPATSGENVLHCSSLPWLSFTGLSHARAFSFADSIPKISFGKMTASGGIRTMPLSIHVHHALMDGFHVAQYVELFEQLLSE